MLIMNQRRTIKNYASLILLVFAVPIIIFLEKNLLIVKLFRLAWLICKFFQLLQ